MTEKFLFTGNCILAGWLISLVVAAAMGIIRNTGYEISDQLPEKASILMVVFATIAVSTTIQLKFGVEKSRIVLLLCIGVSYAAGMVVSRAGGAGSDASYQGQSGGGPSDTMILLIIAGASAAAVFIAYQLGVRIMEKKRILAGFLKVTPCRESELQD